MLSKKKAVNTRWLSLHVSVDGIYDEHPGLLETMNVLQMEGGTGVDGKGLC